MSTRRRFTEEFKLEAVKQVVEREFGVRDVAARLGTSPHSLYAWINKYGIPAEQRLVQDDQLAKLKRLEAELRRVTEERDIPKKGRRVLCQGVRLKYAFIKKHQHEHAIRTMCKVLRVHHSGYYAWLKEPLSSRAYENQMIVGQIKQAWLASGTIYGYRKIHDDLQDLGIACGEQRVYRLMKAQGLRSQTGYKRKPRHHTGKPHVAAPNHLGQQFDVLEPNETWVTDITYIRTHEGWLYLAVVLDLFSRQIVGWSMQGQMDKELVVSALLMALWKRKPKQTVMIHSDQGSQFSSYEWQAFLKEHNLKQSMSRRGNCHDNAVVESFFQLLKRERIKRKTYASRAKAREDIFDYIEMFYNPVRRHSYNNGLSRVRFEEQYQARLGSV
ncbi:IS3 family transposase [Polynucleobacter paneuropaeus]|nr:IS3 family transposase [Polynucleobacter paneuropaeus]